MVGFGACRPLFFTSLAYAAAAWAVGKGLSAHGRGAPIAAWEPGLPCGQQDVGG